MNPILGVILALSGLGSLFGRKSGSGEQPLTDPEMRQQILDVLGIQKRRLVAQDPLLTAVNQMALGMLPVYARKSAPATSGWTPPTDEELLDLAERIRNKRKERRGEPPPDGTGPTDDSGGGPSRPPERTMAGFPSTFPQSLFPAGRGGLFFDRG